MPIAATGPVDLFELSSENSRHSSPMTTVVADATSGSSTPRHARFIASKWLSWRCSSSRYRDTRSSA